MSTQAIGNTGIPAGAKIFKKPVKAFLVQTFDDSGLRNDLDFSSTTSLTKAALDALVQNSDPSKRWYPLPKLYDAVLAKGDPVLDTAGDGTNFFIQEGVRTSVFMLKQQDATLIQSFDTLECAGNADWSIFFVDTCDQVLVEQVEAKKGRPLQIATSTFNAFYQFMTDTTSNNITVNFDFDKFLKDGRLKVVEVDSDANILKTEGLKTVRVDYSTVLVTVTAATGIMTFDYGPLGADIKYKGAVTADFSLDEISPTPGVVPGFAVAEGLPGVYAITYTLEAQDDVLELTSTSTGLAGGFEVETNSRFTIP